MKVLFSRLSEKDRRRYAAVEADKLGHGGQQYIADLFGIDIKTIRQGLSELDVSEDPAGKKIRKKGGGRKRKLDVTPGISSLFMDVVREHTAGSPQHDIRWTNLRQPEIARRISAKGTKVSRRIVRQILKKHGFVSRQAQKKKSFKQHPDRNPQFENITALKARYLATGQPVLSMDTKKKEMIGNFYRGGKLYTRETIEVLDHDFPSYSEGKIVPHGLYDIGLNKAHVNLGMSHDTTEFACDSVARWWHLHGRHDHPNAKQLLILCDGGGSNPSRSPLFQQDLQSLANTINLEIRIAHYPPYCSKHNPIEHRVFPHVTRACEGVVFGSVPLVKQLIENTHTSTGLKVTVDILDRVYETGRKVAQDIKSSLRVVADTLLPVWNYTVLPSLG
ncbi:MAG: ISAzo13 family transposase [Sulfuricellaceae bacterium]|nr:ISAzo13 family transposase [Sulfuricellaceae bacterium]